MGAAIWIGSILGLVVLYLLYKKYDSWLDDKFDYDAFSLAKIIINIVLLFMVIMGSYKYFYTPKVDFLNTQVILFSGSALLICFYVYVAIKTSALALNSLAIFVVTVPLAFLILGSFLLAIILSGSSEPETKTIYKNRDIPKSGDSLF